MQTKKQQVQARLRALGLSGRDVEAREAHFAALAEKLAGRAAQRARPASHGHPMNLSTHLGGFARRAERARAAAAKRAANR